MEKKKEEEWDIIQAAIEEVKRFTKCPACKSDNTIFIRSSKLECNDCKHVWKTEK